MVHETVYTGTRLAKIITCMLENYSIASVEERLINLVENETDFTVFCKCCVPFVLRVDNRENKSTTNSEVSPSCWVKAYEVFPS